MFDEILEVSLLCDFYGPLLTEHQRRITELYHEENYSLAEIAEELDISRQGVHDALKTSEKLLREYEEKLGLVAAMAESGKKIAGINEILDGLEGKTDEATAAELEKIRILLSDIG